MTPAALVPVAICHARPSLGAPTADISASVRLEPLSSATLRAVCANVSQAMWALTAPRNAQLGSGALGACRNVSVLVVPLVTLLWVSVSRTVSQDSPDPTVLHRVRRVTMVLDAQEHVCVGCGPVTLQQVCAFAQQAHMVPTVCSIALRVTGARAASASASVRMEPPVTESVESAAALQDLSVQSASLGVLLAGTEMAVVRLAAVSTVEPVITSLAGVSVHRDTWVPPVSSHVQQVAMAMAASRTAGATIVVVTVLLESVRVRPAGEDLSVSNHAKKAAMGLAVL